MAEGLAPGGRTPSHATLPGGEAGEGQGEASPVDPQLISICIPTYRRPVMLQKALDSCVVQGYRPFEIVIGDNSDDDETEAMVERYARDAPGLLRYRHHRPALDANGNTNDLFKRARGRRLVLLHDDDLLCADALWNLDRCWGDCPELDAAFGKQYVISQAGTVLADESERLNRDYQRVSANAGLQTVPARAGICRMFPNNGFMVRTELARHVGYRPLAEVGQACDFDFGLRLCLEAGRICFLDRYVSYWRLSDDALSRRSYPACDTYRILSELDVSEELREARAGALFSLAPAAASGFARLGQVGAALRVLASRHYGPRRRLSLRFLFHLCLAARSMMSAAAGRSREGLRL